jgi:hypothetical protein
MVLIDLTREASTYPVMAGLVPAIYVFLLADAQDVDARDV